ncbi:SLATT domain-containing protein [Cellulomonas sp. Y8]|uniref:SLATT domain-containing protein n=1 Tax=Cellulomonas sp. Y8 TaxID=2591145 RepID=UPI003D73140A
MSTTDDDTDALRDAIVRELEDLAEDMQWTEKTHFAHAEALDRVNLWLGLGSTISASVAAATVVGDVAPVVTGVCALLAAIASGVLTFLKPRDTATRHLNAARQLGALGVRVRQAVRIDLAPALGAEPSSWRDLAHEIAQEKARIDQDSPGTGKRAFDTARDKINAGHFEHKSDRP